VIAGKAHLGYQRREGDKVGRWILRVRRDGRYSEQQIGAADDDRAKPADGTGTLTYDQARAKALDLASGARSASRITVIKAMADYLDYLKLAGKDLTCAENAAVTHILPRLGDELVESLTAAQLRRWLDGVASAPARKRSSKGQQRHKALGSEESVRKRRASANRVLTVLKAALNLAYNERKIASNDAWRSLRKFKGVDNARVRYLSTAEAIRFLNACNPSFRDLARAALETGMRHMELARLEVADFNEDAGTVVVRKSKSGKARHVVLTAEGAAFFRRVCAGKAGSALMFARPDGEPWARSSQGRYVAEANRRAKIEPPVTFHGLRHSWASLAVMNGVPLMVVARNLGHRDTTMVERTYGHLSQSYVFDAIRQGAPRFAVGDESNVEPIRQKSKR
jgi:integrase